PSFVSMQSTCRPTSSTATALSECLCTSTPITIICSASYGWGDRRADRPHSRQRPSSYQVTVNGAALRGETAENDFVHEVAVDPRSQPQRALVIEPRALRCLDHPMVVGERLQLQPMQPPDAEAVTAQNAQHVGPKPTATKAGTQRNADVGEPVVQIDTPEQRLPGEVATLDLDDREERDVIGRLVYAVRRRSRK